MKQTHLRLVDKKPNLRLVYARRSLGSQEDSPIDEDRCLFLWWCVLEQSIQDAIGCTNFKIGSENERDAINEARSYLGLFELQPLSVESPEVGTVEWICNLLNFDIATVRAEVEDLILRGVRRRTITNRDERLKELIVFHAKRKAKGEDFT